jgi:hypothetical protein
MFECINWVFLQEVHRIGEWKRSRNSLLPYNTNRGSSDQTGNIISWISGLDGLDLHFERNALFRINWKRLGTSEESEHCVSFHLTRVKRQSWVWDITYMARSQRSIMIELWSAHYFKNEAPDKIVSEATNRLKDLALHFGWGHSIISIPPYLLTKSRSHL